VSSIINSKIENMKGGDKMDWADIIAIVVTAVLAILAGVYGEKFKLIRREIKEFEDTFMEAYADRDISREELKQIVKEFLDIIKAFKKGA